MALGDTPVKAKSLNQKVVMPQIRCPTLLVMLSIFFASAISTLSQSSRDAERLSPFCQMFAYCSVESSPAFRTMKLKPRVPKISFFLATLRLRFRQ